MRARSALALALGLSLPLVLGALPAPRAGLEAHAADQLSLQLEALLGRVHEAEARGAATLPAAPSGSSGAVLVHWLAGERAWTTWADARAQPVDLDGDGKAELRVLAEAGQWPRLVVQGVAEAPQPWVAWIEAGDARWGLSGSGLSPAAVGVRLLNGQLDARIAGAQGAAWQAAFALTGQAQRSVAWLAEPSGPRAFEVAAGEGWQATLASAGAGGLRLVVLDGARPHDVTLRGAPAGANLAQEVGGALRYLAPAPGGQMAYRGDASPAGQRGDLGFDVAPLPRQLSLQPEGDGAAFEATEPTDLLFDWTPPGGQGLRVVGNDVDGLRVTPGATGGMVVAGEHGTIAVQRPGGVKAHVVDLASEGSTAVAAPSPWPAAFTALGLAGVAVWAAWPKLRGAWATKPA